MDAYWIFLEQNYLLVEPLIRKLFIKIIGINETLYTQLQWAQGGSLLFIIYAIYGLRIWKFFFDYNFQIVSVKYIWRHELTGENYHSFFLKYKNIFGNVKILCLIALLFMIITSTACVFIAISQKMEENILYLLYCNCIIGIMCLFMQGVYTMLKRRHSIDNFGIRDEIYYNHVAIVSIFVIGIIAHLLIDRRELILLLWVTNACISIALTITKVITVSIIIKHAKKAKEAKESKTKMSTTRLFNTESQKQDETARTSITTQNNKPVTSRLALCVPSKLLSKRLYIFFVFQIFVFFAILLRFKCCRMLWRSVVDYSLVWGIYN